MDEAFEQALAHQRFGTEVGVLVSLSDARDDAGGPVRERKTLQRLALGSGPCAWVGAWRSVSTLSESRLAQLSGSFCQPCALPSPSRPRDRPTRVAGVWSGPVFAFRTPSSWWREQSVRVQSPQEPTHAPQRRGILMPTNVDRYRPSPITRRRMTTNVHNVCGFFAPRVSLCSHILARALGRWPLPVCAVAMAAGRPGPL